MIKYKVSQHPFPVFIQTSATMVLHVVEYQSMFLKLLSVATEVGSILTVLLETQTAFLGEYFITYTHYHNTIKRREGD